MTKMRTELKISNEAESSARVEISRLKALIEGERTLREAMVNEAIAKARDVMRLEVAAAFKDGIETSKALFQTAKDLYK